MSIFDRIKDAIIAPFEDDQSKRAILPENDIPLWIYQEAEQENARQDDLLP